MSILVDENIKLIIQGITGREAVSITRNCLDYGTKVVGGVTPGRRGSDVYGVPVYDCVKDITAKEKVDAALVAVPARFAPDAALESIENGIPLVVIVTERIPRKDVAQILEMAEMRGTRVIGPNSLGLISPGKAKIGDIGGPLQNTIRAYTPGNVGIMSRSGGMTTELANLLTQNGLGQSTAISVGADPLIGSTFVDLMPLFEADPETKGVVIFSEPGGNLEADLANWVEKNGGRIPIIVFVAGRFMDDMPGVRFGHTVVMGRSDTAAQKIAILKEAGMTVADDLSDIPRLVKERI